MEQEQKTELIGTVIKVDEGSVNYEEKIWKKSILPELQKVIDKYQQVVSEKFTNESLNQFVADNFSVIKEKAIAANTDKINNPILRNIAINEIEKEISLVKNLWFCVIQERNRHQPPRSTIGLNWEDIEIKNGKPIVNVEQIKERYSIRVETELQATILLKLHALKDAYNDVMEFARHNGYHYGIMESEGTTLIEMDYQYNIKISEDAVLYFK